MSHFTVLVVGENIREQLKPYCEHTEFTSEYHEFVDKTDEVLKDWETDTNSEWYPEDRIDTDMITINKLNDGEDAFIRYDDIPFIRPKVGSRFMVYYRRNKEMSRVYVKVEEYIKESMLVSRIPEPKEIPVCEVYADLDTFAKDYHGYEKEGDRYGYYANPNAKWDWYQVGGRWNGFFKCKENNENVVALGEPGAFQNKPREGYVDSIVKKDIDLDGMFSDAMEKAIEEYDIFMEVFKDIEIPSWKEIREKHGENIDDARDEFHNTDYNKILSAVDRKNNKYVSSWIWAGDIVDYFKGFDKDRFIHSRVMSSIATFAVVMNGTWIERGDMGWWGCVSDERDDWETEFCKIFSSIAETTRLTVVDCHI